MPDKSCLEPIKKLFLSNFPIAILVQILESSFESVVVEFFLTADLAVELLGDRLDLFALKETRLVLVKSNEEILNNLLKFV